METLRSIERKAIDVRDDPPRTLDLEIEHWRAVISLPMDRRMYVPKSVDAFANTCVTVADGTASIEDAQILFENKSVDVEELRCRVRRRLQTEDTTTLVEVVLEHPLEHGLAEIVAYLQLTDESFTVVLDQDAPETLSWSSATRTGDPITRAATLPRAIFCRTSS